MFSKAIRFCFFKVQYRLQKERKTPCTGTLKVNSRFYRQNDLVTTKFREYSYLRRFLSFRCIVQLRNTQLGIPRLTGRLGLDLKKKQKRQRERSWLVFSAAGIRKSASIYLFLFYFLCLNQKQGQLRTQACCRFVYVGVLRSVFFVLFCQARDCWHCALASQYCASRGTQPVL